MKMTNSSKCGAFSLVELFALLACACLAALLILPALARHRIASGRINCVNNQKMIGLAFRMWALDNQDRYPMQVPATNGGTMEFMENGPAFVHFLVISNELSTPKVLVCPDEPDSSRINATTFVQSANLPQGQIGFASDNYLSYFVGVDASPTLSGALLSGDRNLAVGGVQLRCGLQQVTTNTTVTWFKPRPRHDGAGFVCLADGSVQRVTDSGFPAILSRTGMATNRLVMP